MMTIASDKFFAKESKQIVPGQTARLDMGHLVYYFYITEKFGFGIPLNISVAGDTLVRSSYIYHVTSREEFT